MRTMWWTLLVVIPLLVAGSMLSQGCQSGGTPESKPAESDKEQPAATSEDTSAGTTGTATEAKEGEAEAKEGAPEAAAPVPEGMEVVKIGLPKPLFAGTPKNIKPRPTLEKYQDKRPPFVAPKGTTNVALKKPVTSSDKEPIIGENELVTDGDKEGTDGSFVEYGPGLQWVQIDLGETCEIYAFVLWHYHMEGRVYHDVVIQVADDPDFIENVQTVFNNDFDNSSGLGIGKDLEWIEGSIGKLIKVNGAKGRYVRLYSRGNTSNDQNHYIEVDVYGKPAK